MFQFPRFPPRPYAFRAGSGGLTTRDCSIRAPSVPRVAAAPRGVSPLARALHRPCRPRHPPRAHPCSQPPRRGRAAARPRARRHAPPHAPQGVRGATVRLAHLSRRSPLSMCHGHRGPPGPRPAPPWGQAGHRPRGGAAGARTPNLRRARAALSRLSYDPRRVGAPGLEPGASALSGPRSDRLSYAPIAFTCAHDIPRRRQRSKAVRCRFPTPFARRNPSPAPRRRCRGSARPGSRPKRDPPRLVPANHRVNGLAPDLGRGGPGVTPAPLPRKEVIQPQLPLRLPCYDFVPITSPALDGCPPEGLAPRLQALPAFVT